MVEGARASSKILSTTTKRRVRSPLHHASRGPPPPLPRGRKDKRSHSHGAIFCAREFFIPPCSLTPSPLRHSWVFPCAHPGRKQKGKRNAERRVVKPALAARGALCGARSPLGVPLRLWPGRQLVPKARHQAMLPRSSPERSILYGRPNRGGGDLALLHGRYPRRKNELTVPVQRAPRMPVVVPAG